MAVFDSKDGMGNFLNYNKYYVTASMGFESLFDLDRKWRIEAGAAAGFLGLFYFGQLIYAIPD